VYTEGEPQRGREMIKAYNLHPIKVTCVHCGITYDVLANPEDIILWQSGCGGNINNCMPYLSVAERELLISRTCNDCWNNLFGEDE